MSVAGSSRSCWTVKRSLRVGRGLAARCVAAGGGGVTELGGLHLGGGGAGHVGRELRVVHDGGVLGLGLRGDVAVVLALTVGQEDVVDDLRGPRVDVDVPEREKSRS